MKQFGFKVLGWIGIALIAVAFMRVVIAYPPPPSPEQLIPSNEKLCSAVLNIRCKVVLKK